MIRLLVLVALVASCSDGDNRPASGVQSLCDPVSDDDLILETETDLDAAANTERVDGDLLVCNTTDVTSLALPVLTRVDGNIIVFANTNIETVRLPLLERLGEDPSALRSWSGLLIEGNPALTDVDAPRLRTVAEHVWVADNAALTELDLPALTTVEGALALRATQIEVLDGFAELRFVGDAVAMYDNTELTEVSGLANLITISTELIVTNNAKLTTVALPELRVVGGFLEVIDDPNLTELDLPAVTTVGRGMTVTKTGLADLGGLAALGTVAGDLSISDNEDLTDLSLPALAQTGGDILIAKHDDLAAVTLDLLTFVGDSLMVDDNDLLASLSLATLAEIAGNLVVNGNDVYPTCAAEALRDAVGTDNIGGDVSIAGNDDEATCP